MDALKILEFLIQKAKQNNDTTSSKNVTFDSLFNELNQMNSYLKNNNKANLECSLDLKLDQMENEIEVLRMQLKQNQFNKTPKFKQILNESNEEKIEKLQNELKESNKKCQVLECLLEQKNKQTEKFNFLFRYEKK